MQLNKIIYGKQARIVQANTDYFVVAGVPAEAVTFIELIV